MPIEVHCPNPNCARVHMVKNRYAGMRGKCPSCGSWMYVPHSGQMPSMGIPRPEGLEEMAMWKHGGNPQPALGASVPSTESAHPRASAEPAQATSSGEESTMTAGQMVGEGEQIQATKKRKFSRLTALVILLGMLGLGAVSAAPYLQPPRLEGSGEMGKDIGGDLPRGVREDHALYVTLFPAGVAAFGLLALLAGLLAGRFEFASLFLIYLATVGSAIILLLALFPFRTELNAMAKVQDLANQRKANGVEGSLTIHHGQQLFAIAGGAALACAMFVLAALLIHRRWWSRLLGFVFLGAIVAVGPVWVYRNELGIQDLMPTEIDRYMPF